MRKTTAREETQAPFDAPAPADLCAMAETASEATLLELSRIIAARMASALHARPVITSWSHLEAYLSQTLARLPTEEFHVLYLDKKNRLICDAMMGRGTVDHCPVYVREVVKRALELDASAVILAHNHPSGDSTPSQADVEMTRTLRDALQTIGLVLHDHVVVGSAGNKSFRSLGLI
jgi:DNA repair protein RadC